jgi:hypothetical protein
MFKLNTKTKSYRRTSQPKGYRLPLLRTTSKAIGPILNAELADLHARNHARQSKEVSS